jgi:hypothetical protein
VSPCGEDAGGRCVWASCRGVVAYELADGSAFSRPCRCGGSSRADEVPLGWPGKARKGAPTATGLLGASKRSRECEGWSEWVGLGEDASVPGPSEMASDCNHFSIMSSPIPFLLSKSRSLVFSSATFRAALWISADASIPWISHCLKRFSSSWRYSFRRALDRLWFSRVRARLACCYTFERTRIRR